MNEPLSLTGRRVVWAPQPRQRDFLSRPEDEALYGGAAGGGKSEALVMEALRQADIGCYRGLILRKTVPQLGELIDKSQRYYPRVYPGARYNVTTHTWTFPSGARIRFGSLPRPQDRLSYQGLAFDFIGFDELTQFEREEYMYLLSRNRPGGPGTRCCVRATANPGGIGHGWVKERFLTAGPPGRTIWESYPVVFPDGHTEMRRRSRIFIPSTVFDNEILLRNDPAYLARLAALPEADRKALLYGDWDSFSGQVFLEWRNDPAHYADRIGTHVISPFRIPPDWHLFRGFDWGYRHPFSVCWFAEDREGRLYHIRELYGCASDGHGQPLPNVGVMWTARHIAEEIRRIEREDPNLRGRPVTGVADPAIFRRDGGESVGELMEGRQVYWDKGDNTRLAGKQQFHNRLAFGEDGRPMLYVFSTCRHFIRTVPSLIYSTVNVEDVDTAGEDHIYDAARYVMMEVPCAPPRVPPVPIDRPFDPLDSTPAPAYAGRMGWR